LGEKQEVAEDEATLALRAIALRIYSSLPAAYQWEARCHREMTREKASHKRNESVLEVYELVVGCSGTLLILFSGKLEE
jgi:hypothetical protein